MSEELLTSASGEETVDDSYDYITAINEMKKNTVSREAYEKLIKERNQLANAVINGESVSNVKPKETPDVDQLRRTLFSGELLDSKYIEAALDLRDVILETEGKDIFSPEGRGVIVTEEDRREAEHTAQVFRECLDFAQGDSLVFKNELMRRVVDVQPVTAARQKQNSYYNRR